MVKPQQLLNSRSNSRSSSIVVAWLLQRVQLFATPWTVAHRASPRPWDSPGKNTGVGCHFLLQGIFQTQGSTPNLLYWQMDSLPLSQLGSPIVILLFFKYSCLGTHVRIKDFKIKKKKYSKL